MTLRNAEVFLRCNDRFAEDTLTLRIATVTPDSLRFEEPFRLVIPRDESPAPLKREVARSLPSAHPFHAKRRLPLHPHADAPRPRGRGRGH